MMTGRVIAVSLFSASFKPEGLPSSVQDVRARASLVDEIDKAMGIHFGTFKQVPGLDRQICALSYSSFDAMLKDVTTTTEKHINDVDNTNTRNGVALSLWSGCISAAKVIAPSTRDGPNTPELRMSYFTNLIEPLCKIDELFKAGVETAPIFKMLRKEEIRFEGVPADSPVLVYKDMPYEQQS